MVGVAGIGVGGIGDVWPGITELDPSLKETFEEHATDDEVANKWLADVAVTAEADEEPNTTEADGEPEADDEPNAAEAE